MEGKIKTVQALRGKVVSLRVFESEDGTMYPIHLAGEPCPYCGAKHQHGTKVRDTGLRQPHCPTNKKQVIFVDGKKISESYFHLTIRQTIDKEPMEVEAPMKKADIELIYSWYLRIYEATPAATELLASIEQLMYVQTVRYVKSMG